MSQLGDLRADFDFAQPPRAPLVLPVRPKTTLVAPAGMGGRGRRRPPRTTGDN
jgi:hypothetical protein